MTSRSRSWPFLRPPVGTFVLTALAPLFTLWSPAISRAQDRWSTPHPGIRQLERSASGPRQIHVTEIDLCAAGISLRATREAERRATVPSWAAASGVEVAINADFFSFDTYLPSGAAASNGTPWHGDSRGEAFVAFGRDRLLLSPDAEVIDPLPDWMR